MLLRSGILIFLIFCVMLPQAYGEDEVNHIHISEVFFPMTKEWKTIKSSTPIQKSRLLAIARRLKSSYLDSRIFQKFEGKDCSFITRALEENLDVESFRLIDIDSDGVQDIIYTGSLQCGEGDIFLVWYGKFFEVRQDVLGKGKALKILAGREPLITSVQVGCCGSPIDDYYLYDLKSLRVKKVVKTTEATVHPEEVQAALKFENANETVLRSAPVEDDRYDEALSGLQGHAVLGNILSKFLGGVAGEILAEYRDKSGKLWVYVLMDDYSMLRYHSPFIVNTGWVEKDSIKEKE